jgi:hypothetical protein
VREASDVPSLGVNFSNGAIAVFQIFETPGDGNVATHGWAAVDTGKFDDSDGRRLDTCSGSTSNNVIWPVRSRAAADGHRGDL